MVKESLMVVCVWGFGFNNKQHGAWAAIDASLQGGRGRGDNQGGGGGVKLLRTSDD